MSQKQEALLAVSALFAKINDNYSKLSYDDAEFRAIRQQVDGAVAAPDAVAPAPVTQVVNVPVIDPVVSEKLDSIEQTLGAIMHLLPEPAAA